MSTRKKLVIVNISGLIGIAISVFIVPLTTPFWIWAPISAAVLLLCNYFALTHKPNLDRTTKDAGSGLVIALGCGLLILELALRLLRR